MDRLESSGLALSERPSPSDAGPGLTLLARPPRRGRVRPLLAAKSSGLRRGPHDDVANVDVGGLLDPEAIARAMASEAIASLFIPSTTFAFAAGSLM